MKRLHFIIVIILLCSTAQAQKKNVDAAHYALFQSDYTEEQKKQFIPAAVYAIDQACQHPETKDDPWTWLVASFVYGTLVSNEQFNIEHVNKTLDCIRIMRKLDTEGKYYDADVANPYALIGHAYSKEAQRLYNNRNYDEAYNYWEKALEYHQAGSFPMGVFYDAWCSQAVLMYKYNISKSADDKYKFNLLKGRYEHLMTCFESIEKMGEMPWDNFFDGWDSSMVFVGTELYWGAEKFYNKGNYSEALEWLNYSKACLMYVPSQEESIKYVISAIDDCENASRNIKKTPSSTSQSGNAGNSSNRQVVGIDVDVDIPVSDVLNENTYVFIIANEHYEGREVPYAINDGRIFKEYCNSTLGIPMNHIKIYEDASGNNIIGCVAAVKRSSEANDGDLNVIFYYAGHAFPDEHTKDAYLLPIDGDHELVETCYSLKRLYQELGSIKTKSCVCLLDACFSGATRENSMLLEGRGVAIKPKDEVPRGNIVVLTSASGTETAHQYKDKRHGLFTYYLLKSLQNSKGNLTLGQLYDEVYKNVKKTSWDVNGKIQTPSVIPSETMGTKWRNIKL